MCGKRAHKKESNHKKKVSRNDVNDIADNIIRFVKSNIKRAAKTTKKNPCRIIEEVVQNLSVSVQAALPLNDCRKRTIWKQRNGRSSTNSKPANLSDFGFSVSCNEHKGETLMLLDSDRLSVQIIIFGTSNNLDLSASAVCWWYI